MVHERRPSFLPKFGDPIINHGPVEPVSGKEKINLEKDCEKILSVDKFSAQDYNSYIDRMIKLLGTSKWNQNPFTLVSRGIVVNEIDHAIAVHFEKDEEKQYVVNIGYHNIDEDSPNIYPGGEKIKLNGNPSNIPSFTDSYFADIEYYPDPSRYPRLEFKTLTKQEPVEARIQIEQTDSLTRTETHTLLKKTFELYKRRVIVKPDSTPQAQ